VNDDAMLHDARLRELAQRLGARAAERLDVDRTAQAVVTRLREQPRVTAPAFVWMRPGWLKLAAAVVLLLGTGLVTRGVLRDGRPTAMSVVPVGEDLRDLTADQLREAIGSLDQPLTDESGVLDSGAGLESLSADELRALLRALEG
jgi:anti-sigma factor RsiW